MPLTVYRVDFGQGFHHDLYLVMYGVHQEGKNVVENIYYRPSLILTLE